MDEPAILTIRAYVQPTERPFIMAAQEQLAEALCDDAGRAWPVQVTASTVADDPLLHSIVVASLSGDVFPLDRPIASIEADWRARLERWCSAAQGTVVLCNLFRHVEDPETRPRVVEKIRRLNRLIVAFSQDYNAFVADIDRTLSFFGAEALQTDYRLGGSRAAEAAAHTLVGSLLAGDLGGRIPADRQASATSRHGGLLQVAPVIERRMQMRV